MAALFFVFLFFHCDFTLTSWDYLTAAAVIYATCLATSQLRTWAEHGIRRATIEVLPSGAVCVRVSSNSTWQPGQHIFVRFLALDLHCLSSHPFTICSLPYSVQSRERQDGEGRNEIVMFIKPRDGMTQRLASLAHHKAGRPVRVMLDGPYGGLQHKSFTAFEKVLLVTGGAGVGFTLPLMESFLQQATSAESNGIAKSTLRVIVAVKTNDEYEWFVPVVQELLSLYSVSKSLVRVEVFVTDTSVNSEILEKDVEEGPSNDTQYEGKKHAEISLQRGHRPNLPTIIHETLSDAKQGSVGVAVCGPNGMLFEIRQTVAAAQIACLRGEQKEVYLHSEHFSW